MVSKSRDGSFDKPLHQSAQDSQFSSPDELVAFAQAYFTSDFPNPEGLSCPIKGTLSGIVRSGEAPDNRLRSHLFGCSECFGEYQNALLAYRAEAKAAVAPHRESWWINLRAALSQKPVRVFAGAITLILLAFVGAYVWLEYRTAREPIVVKRDSAPVVAPSENPANSNLPSSNVGASPSPVRPVEHITSQTIHKQTNRQKAPVLHPPARPSSEGELIVMSIDLGGYAVTRGGAASGGEIKFPRTRTRLLLTLPAGSAKGLYTISVIGPVMRSGLRDASGFERDPSVAGAARPKKNASVNIQNISHARSTDGKTLAATLDMRGLSPQKYTLCISREGEPPIDVSIVVKDPMVVVAEERAQPKGRIVVRPIKRP